VLEGLQPVGAPRQRQDRHAVALHRPGVYARVAGGGGADELVERDAVGAGQRQQQFQVGAALTLSRARRSVLVVDGGQPRNAPAGHVHNYLGREGTPPGELLAIGRREVEGYGGRVVPGDVAGAEPIDGPDIGFVVRLAEGMSVLGRRLLVTTGLVDELPDVPGLVERWGRDVLHCPYCHGWEVQAQPIGVLATGPAGVHQALLFRQWSADVTLFLHTAPPLTAEQAEQLAARDITVVPGEVAGLEVTDDELTGVRLSSERVVARRAVVVAPLFSARAGLLAGLGLEPAKVQMGGFVMGTRVEADPTGATSVRGVHVAGNVADLHAQVLTSAAAGLAAAAALNADLMAEDTGRAVAALRAGRDHPAGVFSGPSEQELCDRVLGARHNGLPEVRA